MSDLKRQTLRGGLAKLSAQAAGFGLRIGSLAVLARLLDPKDFGLVAMVTAVTGVFSLFKDAGLSVASVQRPTITDGELSALFWVNVLVGAVLTALAMVLAPVLSNFYKEPRIFWVTMAIACGFIINASGVQHSALLQRQMRFVTLALIEISSLICSIAIGIGLALAGLSYWALVAMALTVPLVSTICYWATSGWIPGKPHRNSEVGSMVRFGGVLTLNGLIMYAAYNVDKLLLGRVWGAEALGVYGRAYQLVNIPTDNLNVAVGSVAFSALSRLHDDPKRLKGYFLKGYSLVVGLTIPVTFACALFADDIISVLLGPKWSATISIFRFLAPTILVFALINPLGWLLFSTGHVRRSLHMAFVMAPLVVLGYVAGLRQGPDGVAIGYSAAMVLLAMPMMAWAVRGSSISTRDLYGACMPPLLSALAAGVVAYGVRLAVYDHLPAVLRLILELGTLSLVYAAGILYVAGQRRFYFEVIRDLMRSGSADEPVVEPSAPPDLQ